MRAAALVAVCAVSVGCTLPVDEAVQTDAAPAVAPVVRRHCPPLPVLRPGAGAAERRQHTQAIARMYADCASAQ